MESIPTFPLRRGTKVVWVGLEKPSRGVVVRVYEALFDGRKTYVELDFQDGTSHYHVEADDPHLCPPSRYKTVHRFRWEINPFQWCVELTAD